MVSDGEFTYVYNTANQMIEVRDSSGGLVEQYWYDHSGNRVKKFEKTTDGGNKTTYYVSGLYETEVYNGTNITNTSYFYANGERIARKVNNGTVNQTYYYHSDHLQSTSVVTRKSWLMALTAYPNSSWLDVSLNESLVRPVVVARIQNESEDDNAVLRLKHISSKSFQIKIEETPGFDGAHTNETVGFIALEEGMITDGGAEIGQAGSIDAGPVWTRVTFPNRFDTIPIVVASGMTTNDPDQGVVRVRNIDITGFDVRIEEYPSQDGEHGLESIGWIALKSGIWTLDGKTLIANTTDSVDDSYKSITFSESFSTTPIILSQIQSYSETDRGSHTRLNNTDLNGFDVKIEEEGETSHSFEAVGYIAIEPSVLRSGAAKIGETKYYPYGVVQEGGSEKYLYTGKERDKGTGLYYYESRYYNPKTGRFVQPDTIIPNVYNPQSLNHYSYVLNNPMRYTDPSGHEVNTLLVLAAATYLFLATAYSVISLGYTGATTIPTMVDETKPCVERKDAETKLRKEVTGGVIKEVVSAVGKKIKPVIGPVVDAALKEAGTDITIDKGVSKGNKIIDDAWNKVPLDAIECLPDQTDLTAKKVSYTNEEEDRGKKEVSDYSKDPFAAFSPTYQFQFNNPTYTGSGKSSSIGSNDGRSAEPHLSGGSGEGRYVGASRTWTPW